MSYFINQNITNQTDASVARTIIKGIKACLLFVLATLISACDPNTDIDIASVLEQEVDGSAYCQSKLQPFAFNVCSVEQDQLISNDDISLNLFWRHNQENTNKDVSPLYRFSALKEQLSANNSQLLFAVNAGMYNDKFAPIGYTVINKQQILSLNLKEGGGNFHLLPNGVFWSDDKGFYITESNKMQQKIDSGIIPNFATQSGPMLVIDGEIHPKFNKESTSIKIRNGVGICGDGTIKFINTTSLVNFYQFAELFRDTFECNNALFLDGGIASAMYAPEIKQEDIKDMGVMIGLIQKYE